MRSRQLTSVEVLVQEVNKRLIPPPRLSINPGMSWTTSNVYAHLSPSVHPAVSLLHDPLDRRACMNLVSLLKIVQGVVSAWVRKSSASSVLFSAVARTDTA